MGVRTAAALVLCWVAVQQTLGQHMDDGYSCDQPTDLVFVLDVSSSISWPDFRHMINFVTNVTSELDVGPGPTQTRVAALTFSTRVTAEFFFNSFMDKKGLQKRIQQITSWGGNTNTHLALQLVDREVFKPVRGARKVDSGVSRVVVVITDGVSRKANATREAAEAVRGHGAQIFAIGVGRDRDTGQLADMASRPSQNYVFESEDFERLSELKDLLVRKACQATTITTVQPSPTPTTPPPPIPTTTTTDIPINDRPWEEVDTDDCVNHPADIYFVLDSSSSIWKNNFDNNVINFVYDIIKNYDIGKDRTRVGVITFSDTVHRVFGLNSYLYKDELLKAVNRTIQYTPGKTNTAQALQEAGYRLESEGRPGVEQLILLITDGQSMDPRSTISTARALRRRGVRLLAVGVGSSVDEGELRAVQGEGQGEVMRVGNFQSLARYSDLLAARSCAPDVGGPWIPIRDASPSPSPLRCNLDLADIVVTYDWTLLGLVRVSHLLSTLHHLTAILTQRGADVTMGVMTTTSCLPGGLQSLLPLSGGSAFSQYSQSVGVVRPQLHRLLKTIRFSAFHPSNGYRGPAARKVVVIVLDESSSSSVLRQMALESAKMRHMGMEVFLITSGSRSASGDGEEEAAKKKMEKKSRKGNGDEYDLEKLWQQFQLPAPSHVIRLPGLDFSDSSYATAMIASALCGDFWA